MKKKAKRRAAVMGLILLLACLCACGCGAGRAADEAEETERETAGEEESESGAVRDDDSDPALPMINVDGWIYEETEDSLPEEAEDNLTYIGEVESAVDEEAWPMEPMQTNDAALVGISVYRYGDDIAAEADGEYRIFRNIAKDSADEDYGIADLPLRLYMTVTDLKEGIATVKIGNQSGHEAEFRVRYALSRREDGEWIGLTADPEISFSDDTTVLADLESVTVKCDLTGYGELAEGTYRLEMEEMSAEFTLDADGNLQQPGRRAD